MDITRLTGRYSRRALQRPNVVYFFWRFMANGLRTSRALLMRRSYADSPAIAQEIRERGIVVGPGERFLTSAGRKALREAGERILQMSRSSHVEDVIAGKASDVKRKKQFLVHLVSLADGIEGDDPLLRLALDTKLLEIVSGYFGLWPCLHAVDAWLNYPTDAPPELSQLWHRDPGDLQLMKVFIYLTDVDEQSGPFTYIRGTHPFGPENASAQALEARKRIADDRMARVFPPESWRICTGPAHTMILADTVGYHRGGKPIMGRRILITFTYTSGTPTIPPTLRVRSMPAWASTMQQCAVRAILTRHDPPQVSRRKK